MISVALFLLFIIFVLCCAWIEVKKFYLYRTKLRGFSKLKEYPVLGVGGRFINMNPENFFPTINQLFHETVQPFAAWIGPKLVIGISDPEDMQTVMNSEHCLNKPYTYTYFRNTTGLLTANKQIWKVHRRALSPAFSTKMLRQFIPVFDDKSKILCEQLTAEVGNTFDIFRYLFKANTDIIMRTQFSMEWDMQTIYGDKIFDIFTTLIESMVDRMINVYKHCSLIYDQTGGAKKEFELIDRCFQFLHSIRETMEIKIAKNRRDYDEDILEKGKETNSLNYIEKCMLSRRNGSFSEQELMEEIQTICLAGVDTSAITLTNVLLMFAIYPELQDKVVNELREIFVDGDSPVGQDDLNQMIYTEMFIKETLRHFPLGPILPRACDNDVALRTGIIPKGAWISMNIGKMHKDPAYWGENVNKFYPEYFSPENFQKIHPYAYLPFSGGSRNCIGMKYAIISLKVMVANLLRKFRITTHLKYEDIKVKTSFSCKIQNKNPVQLQHRVW